MGLSFGHVTHFFIVNNTVTRSSGTNMEINSRNASFLTLRMNYLPMISTNKVNASSNETFQSVERLTVEPDSE